MTVWVTETLDIRAIWFFTERSFLVCRMGFLSTFVSRISSLLAKIGRYLYWLSKSSAVRTIPARSNNALLAP